MHVYLHDIREYMGLFHRILLHGISHISGDCTVVLHLLQINQIEKSTKHGNIVSFKVIWHSFNYLFYYFCCGVDKVSF